MNESEQYIFRTVCTRKRHPIDENHIQNTTYTKLGNYVVCELMTDISNVIGIAKRNPLDKFDYSIGQKLAFNRAVKELIKVLTFGEFHTGLHVIT